MRCLIVHKTNAHWESGAAPGPELVARVGGMIGAMAEAGVLRAAEGLRATALGVRLSFSRGRREVIRGPFGASRGTPDGFAIVRVQTLDDAIGWATRLARVRRASEIDIRPVTEPWDIGFGERPSGLEGRRFMLEHKVPAATQREVDDEAWRALLDEMKGAGVLLCSECFDDTATPLRVRTGTGQPIVSDGPFAETKELIGGFVLLALASREDARKWLLRYADTVGAEEADALFLADG